MTLKLIAPCVLAVVLLAACRDEAPGQRLESLPTDPEVAVEEGVPLEAGVDVPVLESRVESGVGYIIGITYPPEANKYPGMARELHGYVQSNRDQLMSAVESVDAHASSMMYDLSLAFSTIADTPEVLAIGGEGTLYTGGAHGAPLVSRFVWLPQQERRLQADALISGPGGWRDVSAYVREQLHAALSLRVDADELEPDERARTTRSVGKMIDEGAQADSENFSEFEPVIGADRKIVAIRFVFPPYQVGPYSDGNQVVEVPARVLLPHVASEYRGLFSTP